MGNEKSERIQTSFLNKAEKVALVWLAERQPRWVTSDMLTYIGVAGAFICAVGFALAAILLLLVLTPLGRTANGAKRWLGFGIFIRGTAGTGGGCADGGSENRKTSTGAWRNDSDDGEGGKRRKTGRSSGIRSSKRNSRFYKYLCVYV